MDTDLKDPRGKLRCLQQAEDEKAKNEEENTKTITIEISKRGFELKGLENIKSRSECIWLLLSSKWLENRALELGYLPEIQEELEKRDKYLANEKQEN